MPISAAIRLAGAVLGLAALAATQSYVDRTQGSGLDTTSLTAIPCGTSGTACGDFDGDGDQDLVTAGDIGQSIHFFRNLGGLQFQDETAASGLAQVTGQFHTLTPGDIDNDGDLDLFACNYFGPGTLFINSGNAFFTEEGASRGLNHNTSNYTANFGDYDRDGWLDLYIGNRETLSTTSSLPNMLYRNTGNGFFQDVTATAGVGDLGLVLGSAFMDYNEDGWPDILVVNDKGQALFPNNLYRNNADGTFTSVAAQLNANNGVFAMGCDYTDVYCDGGVDFIVTDGTIHHLFNRWDPASGQYIDEGLNCGFFSPADGWSCLWVDHGNDGWPDVHITHEYAPDSLFINPALPAGQVQAWQDVAFASGAVLLHPHRGTASADFNNDGRIDFIHRNAVGPNPAPSGLTLLEGVGPVGNWIKFRTFGTVSNRDGIGTRIDVTIGSHTQRQWVRTGVGFMTSPDMRLHFGVGTATTVDSVVIEWPSGQIHQLDNVPVNQIVDIVEPFMQLAAPATVGGTTTLEMSVPSDAGLPYAMLLALGTTPQSQIPDGRFLPLALDFLSSYTIVPGNIFLGTPLGSLDAAGVATTSLSFPNQPALSGLTLVATGATFEPPGFPLVRTIFPTAVTIQIQ